MRGMALGPVNPHQVNRMGGVDPVSEDEFTVTHLTSTRLNNRGKTSGDRQVTDHRGTDITENRRQRVSDRQADGHRGN